DAAALGRSADGPPVAPVGSAWGRAGREHLMAQARLAANVAARLVVPDPGGGLEQPAWEPCRAPAVVALWLAAQASPQAAEGLRQNVAAARSRFETFELSHDVDRYDPGWGVRAGQFALALLDRPPQPGHPATVAQLGPGDLPRDDPGAAR